MSSRKADEEVFWRKAIRKCTKVTAVLVVLCALAISIANLLGLLPELEWLKERERTMNLLLWASIVSYLLPRIEDLLSSIKEKESYVNQALKLIGHVCANSVQLGIQDIYKSRQDLDQLHAYERLISEAKKDLFIVGITLRDTLSPKGQKATFLKKVVEDGVSLRLLILHPKLWPNKDPVISPVADSPSPLGGGDLKADFSSSLSSLEDLAKKIHLEIKNTRRKGTLEVRFYDQAPTLALTIADGTLRCLGRMRLELTPYNAQDRVYFRPLIDLRPVYDGDLYHEFRTRYELLWKACEGQTFIKADSQDCKPKWDLIKLEDRIALGVGVK